MTAIIITAPTTTTVDTFVADAEAGKIQFHKERDNGTTRRVHFLTGTAYEEALWVQDQRDAGRTMRDISAELHEAVASVRRRLSDLALTEAVREADAEELAEMLHGAEEATEGEPTTEAAPAGEELDADLPKTTEEFLDQMVQILKG